MGNIVLTSCKLQMSTAFPRTSKRPKAELAVTKSCWWPAWVPLPIFDAVPQGNPGASSTQCPCSLVVECLHPLPHQHRLNGKVSTRGSCFQHQVQPGQLCTWALQARLNSTDCPSLVLGPTSPSHPVVSIELDLQVTVCH